MENKNEQVTINYGSLVSDPDDPEFKYLEPKLNIALIGSAGCGKTSYLKKISGENFERRYIPTHNIVTRSIKYKKFNLNILDFAGQEVFSFTANDFKNVDYVMLLSDATSKLSYGVNQWKRALPNGNNLIPILYCFNKIDCKDASIGPPIEQFDIFYFSVKTGQGIYEPLDFLTTLFRSSEGLSNNVKTSF